MEFRDAFVRVCSPVFGQHPERRIWEFGVILFGMALMVNGIQTLSGMVGIMNNTQLFVAIAALFGTVFFFLGIHWILED